ncbi:MAG: AAC(3) family N-acetyltransferase [Bacteroidota bacterium]
MNKIIRKLLPKKVLSMLQKWKKNIRKKELLNDKKNGNVITEDILINELKAIGIKSGDTILVHSSMSKIGYLENGSKTFVNALIKLIGTDGNILMPSSPNEELQLNYIRKKIPFDVKNTTSKLGAITEEFRKLPEVIRSLNPLEPVCAWGKDAVYLTEGHLNEITPYTRNSPFRRIIEKNGKILYIGVTLDNAGTSLHTLEDEVDFKFEVYYSEMFETDLINYNGNTIRVKTKVHNPVYSALRKCDQLIPMFINEKVCEKKTLGKSECLIFDAKKMLESMLKNYHEKGITMYTPTGKE